MQDINIRNIAILGHGSEGKTTLTEAMLFAAGAIDRQGRVEDGSTIADYDPEEIKRGISISAAVAPFDYKGVKVNVVDVPGYFDFIGEAMGPLKVVEGALIVVGAVSGLTVGAEKAWANCEKFGVAKMFVVNQMDRENADFGRTVEGLQTKYGAHVVPVQLPIMEGGLFKGVVSILDGKAYAGISKDMKEIPVPADLADELEAAREAIVEAAAGADEALMEKYFEEGTLSSEDLYRGLHAGIAQGEIVPVVMTAAASGAAVPMLLSAVIELMPSPVAFEMSGTNVKTGEPGTRKTGDDAAPFSAYVFKTVADPFVGKLSLFKVVSGTLTGDVPLYNANAEKAEKVGTIYVMRGKKQQTVQKLTAGDIGALAKLQFTSTGNTLCDASKPIKFGDIPFPQPCISMAVYAKKDGEEDKIFSGLNRLMEEDPTIRVEKNVDTTESILSGLGELHIEVVSRKLASKFGVEALLQDPRIPYRETIRKPIRAEGRHKKQTGGHGQFGHVWIEFSPITEGTTDFEFVDAVVGGVVPRNFIPAVEKGLRENLRRGVLGYPVVNLSAKLFDGSYHAVDSSEMAFKTAARLAFKKMIDASPVLLEPMCHVEVMVPDEYMGDIIGDMNRRRGRIMGMNQVDGQQQVVAEVPLAEMFKYATDLRSMTQARGSFTMQFERYEEVPAADAKKIIEAAKKEEDDED